MSLYRQAQQHTRRRLLGIVVVALLIGGGAGFAIARATAPGPSLAAQLSALRASLSPTAGFLEVVPVGYRSAVAGGRVTRRSEYQGVRDGLARARTAFTSAREDLQALAPDATQRLAEQLQRLQAAVDAHAPQPQVARLAAEARRTLTGLLPAT